MRVECPVDEETRKAVSKLVARRGEKVTFSDMCSELISTGAFRRIAANKWSDEHAGKGKPRKARKVRAVKKAPKKITKKAPKKIAPKAPPTPTPEVAAAPPPAAEVAAANHTAPSPLD